MLHAPTAPRGVETPAAGCRRVQGVQRRPGVWRCGCCCSGSTGPGATTHAVPPRLVAWQLPAPPGARHTEPAAAATDSAHIPTTAAAPRRGSRSLDDACQTSKARRGKVRGGWNCPLPHAALSVCCCVGPAALSCPVLMLLLHTLQTPAARPVPTTAGSRLQRGAAATLLQRRPRRRRPRRVQLLLLSPLPPAPAGWCASRGPA